jgi:hypothetical protein
VDPEGDMVNGSLRSSNESLTTSGTHFERSEVEDVGDDDLIDLQEDNDLHHLE